MCDLTKYERPSRQRTAEARKIADALRHDEKLHRLAMTAVFVLDYCRETFGETTPGC